MTMPKTTYEELKMEKRMLAIQLPKGIGTYQGDKDSAYNAVTIAVSWTGTVGAPRIMKDAVERLIKSSETYPITYMKPNSVDGTCYTYQFRTPVKVGPAWLQSQFSAA